MQHHGVLSFVRALALLAAALAQPILSGRSEAEAEPGHPEGTAARGHFEAAPPVPRLTREAFDNLPVPGKYLLQLVPKSMPLDERESFEEFWDLLATRAPESQPFLMSRVDCGREPGFCRALVGPHVLEHMESTKTFRLLSTEFSDDGRIGINVFHQDSLDPNTVNTWVRYTISRRQESLLMGGDDLPESRSGGRKNIALLMLSVDGLGVRSDIWCRFLGLAAEQDVDVHLFLHDKSNSIGDGPLCPMGTNIGTNVLHALANRRIFAIPGNMVLGTQWGTASLLKAIVYLLRYVVYHPEFRGADRYFLVSENSVPLVDPKTLLRIVSGPGYNGIDDNGNRQTLSVFQELLPGQPSPTERIDRYRRLRPRYEREREPEEGSRGKGPRGEQTTDRARTTTGHETPPHRLDLALSDFSIVETWMVLDRAAGAWFAAHDYFAEFELSYSAEESYFVSLCRRFGLSHRLASAAHHTDAAPAAGSEHERPERPEESHPMYTQWSTDFGTRHPDTLTEITQETLQRWGDGRDKKHSFLFARRISEQTRIDLPWIKDGADAASGVATTGTNHHVTSNEL